jgi:hypothetical protein
MAVMLFCISVRVSGQPNQTSNSKDRNPDPKCPASISSEDHSVTNYYPQKAEADPPKWYTPFERPDWWLVVIAAATGLAIAYQAREMKRATEAMKESTKLQEIGLRQWVDVENWEIRAAEYVVYQMAARGRTILSRPDKVTIDIMFDVVNSSPRPLTVQQVIADVHVAGRKDWQNVISDDTRLLAPEGKRPVILAVTLIGDEIDRYILDDLMISINGRVFFKDGLGKINDQPVGNVGTCGVNGYRFMKYIGKTQTGHASDNPE